jgi:hypothetical protein
MNATASSQKPVAVLFVHGIEIDDPGYAQVPEQLLRKHFARALNRKLADVERSVVVEAVNWAPVLEPQQKRLLDAMYPRQEVHKLFERLRDIVVKLNRGAMIVPYLELGATLLKRNGLFSRSPLNYAAARWMFIHLVGDVVAYERTPSTDANYTRIHQTFTDALSRLAQRVPPGTPLVVIAHSLGTVIASNFLYDLQEASRRPTLLARRPVTPIERGETLCSFYTLGSPLAVWCLRYPDRPFDRPVSVPSPLLAQHQPGAPSEWINFYDDDDLFAYPLRGLSDAYARAVKADVNVKLGGPLYSMQPLVHPFYWTSDRVMRPIAENLARIHRAIQADHAYAPPAYA